MKSYKEMIKLDTFEERLEYLKLHGNVGEMTFGGRRQLNQVLYRRDPRWRKARREAIIRDKGCDLGCEDRPIDGPIYVHHINPITDQDILDNNPRIFLLDELVCSSLDTHNRIHFNKSDDEFVYTERKKGDTTLW